MKLGAAAGVVSVLLAQTPEVTDSLGAALSRAQAMWTKQAAGGETTVLAYDRGVTALVGRATELRAKLLEEQVRTRELAAATRALHSVPPDELSGVGKVRHFERIADAEAAESKLRAEVVKTCRTAAVTLAELEGRVSGKIDTLTMARQVCGADGGTGSLCANVPAALTMYEALQVAARREAGAMSALCSSAW